MEILSKILHRTQCLQGHFLIVYLYDLWGEMVLFSNILAQVHLLTYFYISNVHEDEVELF